MYQAIIVIHILLGLSIIGLILMQQGKGADAGATFGGGASGSVFGAQGAASFLSRTTAILATLFFVTSLGLAWINGNKGAAADFMSTPSAEKETVETGLPPVDAPALPAAVPAPQPESKAPVAPLPEQTEKPVETAPPVSIESKQPEPAPAAKEAEKTVEKQLPEPKAEAVEKAEPKVVKKKK